MPKHEITLDFTEFDKVINPAFYDLLKDEHRYLALKGGAGSSKSWSIAQILVYIIVTQPGHRILVMRKVGKTLRNSVIALILGTISSFGMSNLFSHNKTDRILTYLGNGNEFIFQGLANRDDSEKLKSIEGITIAWLEETTEFLQHDFTQVDLRLRANSAFPTRIFLTFNPINENSWVKKLFFDSDAYSSEVLRIHESTYKDNPHLPQQYIDTLENLINVDPQYYNIYVMNLWGVLKGLIYKFPIMEEVYPDRFDVTIYGLDFGYTHPMSLTKLGIVDKDVYIEEKFYETERTVGDLIAKLPGLGVKNTDIIYCDSARPDDIVRMKRAGYYAVPAAKGPGSVLSGIGLVKEFILHTNSENVNVNNEFGLYKWREDRNENQLEEPLKENDHAMDGIRYALFTAFGKPNKKVWVV